jgi:hypothetical protein
MHDGKAVQMTFSDSNLSPNSRLDPARNHVMNSGEEMDRKMRKRCVWRTRNGNVHVRPAIGAFPGRDHRTDMSIAKGCTTCCMYEDAF